MSSRKNSKKVSFGKSSKIVEIDETVEIDKDITTTIVDDDNFDPDNIEIDLITGKKKKQFKGKNSNSNSNSIHVESLSTSIALIPYHLPLLLFALLSDDKLMTDTKIGIQNGFYNLSILSLIFTVMVGEKAKCERNPNLKSNGPTAFEFLYTSLTFPFSILLSIPIYLTFLLFGAPAGPLTPLTFYLASHVSLIVFFPLLNVYKLNDKNFKKIWWKLLTFQLDNWKFNQIYSTSIGALIGCWLGVIPIPLDWDRDWQDWPITLLIGTYIGGFLGGLASYIYGRYVMSKYAKNT